MELGIILPIAEESFRYAASLGLDFVEFCINGSDEGELLLERIDEILRWIDKYKVKVGSIGRWKSEILNPEGDINEKEVKIAERLIYAAQKVGCPNYICGCNYVSGVSEWANYDRAINFFETLLNLASNTLRISVYNCRKMNFVNSPKAWELVMGRLPGLGIKFDPSHSRYAGSDYLQEVMDWGERIQHVHLKGSMLVNGQRVDDPPAGLDQTDWKTFLNILRVKGYDRGLSIEPHSQIWKDELGKKGVIYTVRYFRDLML